MLIFWQYFIGKKSIRHGIMVARCKNDVKESPGKPLCHIVSKNQGKNTPSHQCNPEVVSHLETQNYRHPKKNHYNA